MPEIDRVGPVASVIRGLRRRCGRCGGGGIFQGFFTLRENCPTCGYRFKREAGFFTGVMLVNFGATIGVLWLGMMAFVLVRATSDSNGSVVRVLVAGVLVAIAFPIAFYPFASSTWAALDLAMRPLDPEEEAEAALRVNE